MRQNGLIFEVGPVLLLFMLGFQILVSGPKSYQDFQEMGPRSLSELEI